MITRLRPLDVRSFFEDRPYKLGETINVTVDLMARGDVEVREGRVDLVCHERWGEVFTMMVAIPGRGVRSRGASSSAIRVPKRVFKENRETYIHSSVTFLEDTQLEPGTSGSYTIELEIQEEPPPHAKEGTLRWNLVTVVDLVWAPDIKIRRAVEVTVD